MALCLRKRHCQRVVLPMLCGLALSSLLYSGFRLVRSKPVASSAPAAAALRLHQPSPPDGRWEDCRIPKDTEALCRMNASKADVSKPCPLGELSQNCALFKEMHGYAKPVDAEEEAFPLAFGMKMHTGAEQAEQLLRTIYRPHNVYCIHIDKKAEEQVVRVMRSIAACLPNVFLTERISFVYGSYDCVTAELILMTCVLGSKVPWKYYINLAAQEFPLRTNLEIIHVLKLLNGTNDIESYPMPLRGYSKFRRKHIIVDGRLQRTQERKQPPVFKFPIRKGTQYSAFSRGYVQSVFHDDHAKAILEYFKNSLSPEENVWATINQLPWIPGSYPVYVKHNPVNEHLSRTVAWKHEDAYPCRGKYVRRVCVFVQQDLPWLLRQPNLFLNKFRADLDPRPAACLEAVLDSRVRAGASSINLTYYRALPHVVFRSKNIHTWDVAGTGG